MQTMILVARPRPHLERTLQALHALGYPPASLLAFSLAEPESLPLTLPPQTSALLLTSPLSCPSLAAHPHALTLPSYAVGPTTAQAARVLGAHVVFTGTDNGHTLAHDILQHSLPPQHFAHLHGDKAGMDWHALLTAAGHSVTPVLTYHTHPVTTLPEAIHQALLMPHSSLLIPLFSSGSARHLANLLKQANIPPSGTALCLSKAVAAEARLHWPHTQTARQPTLEGLLALLPQAPIKPN